MFFSLNWILSDDKVSVEKSLDDIAEYLKQSKKIDETGRSSWSRKFDSFNLKMITIGSVAMAFSMLSGKTKMTSLSFKVGRTTKSTQFNIVLFRCAQLKSHGRPKFSWNMEVTN